MVKRSARILIFISLGLLAFYLVFRSQPNPDGESLIARLLSDFGQANWIYLIIMSASFMLSNVFRALRWQQMLQPLGVKISLLKATSAIMVAYLTNLVIPRAGEIARATALSGTAPISFEKALGTVVLDRVLDMICLLLIGLVTVILASDLIFGYFDQHLDLSDRWKEMQQGQAWWILILVLAFLVFAFYKFTTTEWYQLKLKAKINVFVAGLWEGLSSIKNIEKPITFLFYTLAIWFLYFFMAFVLFKALDNSSTPGAIGRPGGFLFWQPGHRISIAWGYGQLPFPGHRESFALWN